MFEFLFGSIAVDFPSRFDLNASIAQLRAASKRSVFAALAHPEAVGEVEARRVRLQRVVPMVSNGFKPHFIGRFEARPDGVHLIGRFTLLPWVKVLVALWLALAVVVAIAGGIAALRGDPRAGIALSAVLAVPLLGVALAAGGRWLARGDIEWLSNVISSALASPAQLEDQIDTTVVDPNAVPATLKVMAGLLALTGAANLLVAGLGLPGLLLPGTGPWRRALGVALGLALLGLARGVYRRRVAAWRLGVAFLAPGLLMGLPGLWVPLPVSVPTPLRIGESILFLALYAYWARWWYAQRVHFKRPPVSYSGV